MAGWEPFVAAAVAPAAVWLLWRAQTLSVSALRSRMVKLASVRGLRWLHATVSWFGVLLHECSHALVLLLSGHGVKEFRAGAESGHVLPARMRKGPIGFLSFLAAALAPLFVPPLLLLLLLHFLVAPNAFAFVAYDATLDGSLDAVRQSLVEIPAQVGLALAALDLATWQGALVLTVALLAMPASRPSHVKGSRFHGTQDEGDVAALRQQIRRNPIVFAAFLALLYGAFFAASLYPPAYWFPFEAIWAVALTGVALALFGAVWWTLVALAGTTRLWAGWLGPATFAAAQILLRIAWRPGTPDGAQDLVLVNLCSLLAWAAVACTLRILLPRHRHL